MPPEPVGQAMLFDGATLFDEATLFDKAGRIDLRPGIVLLHRAARDPAVARAIDAVAAAAPFRRMRTPGGHEMSVAMTNCGAVGWVTDRAGYRYAAEDPQSGRPWPAMPGVWRDLARDAAARAGFAAFDPDACLVNLYEPGARMGLHCDRDEADFAQPIVSVSLGLPATFLLGGPTRRDRTMAVALDHGDVLVFGGPERLVYHGVRPVKATGSADPATPLLARARVNLTFRRALA